jgi:FkbH-like protein/FkbM family methyltransferase
MTFLARHLGLSPGARLPEVPAEIRLGLRSVPELADHGFHDMVVLPGSFFVDLALELDELVSGAAQRRALDSVFHNPVILSGKDDVVIGILVRQHEGSRVSYAFFEKQGEAAVDPARHAAEVRVERLGGSQAGIAADPVPSLQDLALPTAGAEFYDGLRANGNQYGPAFQGITALQADRERVLAKIDASPAGATPFHRSRTRLLDVMAQVLAPLLSGPGKTFILKSIDRIEVADAEPPATLWGEATVTGGAGSAARGAVRLFDATGRVHAAMSGVAFALLDSGRTADKPAATRLVIASNFTAEPLEDSLGFWSDRLDVPLDIEFAPYNQVFQQLLDAGSSFRRNSGGVNAVLLSLEEWARGGRRPLPRPGTERVERALAGRSRHVLPNGLEVAHLIKYETEYLYQEIFGDQAYLRHGIQLRDGDTVVDIGANIGMFSLFVMSQRADLNLYAFEPAPLAFDALQANLAAYGTNARAFRLGVSDRKKTATFTYYEKSSVFSSFHSDETDDREAIEAVVRNMLRDQNVPEAEMDAYVAELTADRLNRREYECELTSLSDVIREQGIEKIDLLKIDAEKSELDILRGIDDEHWARIRQIVIEIHDRTGEAVRKTEALLTGRGFRCAIVEETLLERSGLYNLYATREGAAGPEVDAEADAVASVRRNVEDFTAALSAFMARSTTPLILCVAPSCGAGAIGSPALAGALDEVERSLLAAAGSMPNVHCIGSAELRRRYALGDIHDPHSHQTAHIPYTADGYAALGTALVRRLFVLRRRPSKVIVLDCDNTLWGGVVGEDGVAGVQLTPGHRALQEFMVAKSQEGLLLCLCSKNNEKDVLDTLTQRADMPLKPDHLAAWQVNWKSKSQNIQALARQLNLGLDSFVFLDDNPVECAEVRANCPEVVTLQMPADPAQFPSFLEHIWPLDRLVVTQEDAARTRMYRENAQRERAREESLSLASFVQGLGLRVDIAPPQPADIPRVSQLTYRTNQFNFTTIRRSEGEIREFLGRDGHGGLVVRVSDRFGDYGLVGVVLFVGDADTLRVDTLLLSCRVLGRGVEHEIMAWLGREAVRTGRSRVVVPFARTERNQPALEFISAVADGYDDADGTMWTIPAEVLANTKYDPERAEAAMALASGGESPSGKSQTSLEPGAGRFSEQLQAIAAELNDAARITAAIAEHRARRNKAAAAAVIPGNSLEAAIAAIWSRVLGRHGIGLHENFFEVGGTSLRAVQVISAIKKELQKNVSIVTLFENPTVAALAARLGAAPDEQKGGNAGVAAAAARGQQRRYNINRPRAR